MHSSMSFLRFYSFSPVGFAAYQYILLLGIDSDGPSFSLLWIILYIIPRIPCSNLNAGCAGTFQDQICYLSLTKFEYLLQVISQWLMDQPPLGHKSPRPGTGRLAFCPACPAFFPTPSPMSSRHINVHSFSINYGILQACAYGLHGCGDSEAERGDQKFL